MFALKKMRRFLSFRIVFSIICGSGLIFVSTVLPAAVVQKEARSLEIRSGQAVQRAQLRKLSWKRQLFRSQYEKVDLNLPGVSLSQVDIYLSQFSHALRRGDYRKAEEFIEQAAEEVQHSLAEQEGVRIQAAIRLREAYRRSLVLAKDLLVPVEDLPEEPSMSDSSPPTGLHLVRLRELVVELAERIARRRVEVRGVPKRIVVSKARGEMYLYEGERLVRKAPVSLGRAGRDTRTGNFRILDKAEKVWGYYQIWMPYWMGIYFAGSSENGFHGIPWGQGGYRYWVNDVGVRDITYGCVMAEDEDMEVLYRWAPVGTPVIIMP